MRFPLAPRLGLTSLARTRQNLPEGRQHHVLLVFDGWSKISETMKRFASARLSTPRPCCQAEVLLSSGLFECARLVCRRYLARLYPGSAAESRDNQKKYRPTPRYNCHYKPPFVLSGISPAHTDSATDDIAAAIAPGGSRTFLRLRAPLGTAPRFRSPSPFSR